MKEQGADPVAGLRADCFGTKGMNVVGDGSAAEAGGRQLERSLEFTGVPTGVEGDLIPRREFRGDFGAAVDFHLKPGTAEKGGGAVDPIVPHAIGIFFLFDRPEIEKRPAGELGFLGLDRVLNHAANDAG